MKFLLMSLCLIGTYSLGITEAWGQRMGWYPGYQDGQKFEKASKEKVLDRIFREASPAALACHKYYQEKLQEREAILTEIAEIEKEFSKDWNKRKLHSDGDIKKVMEELLDIKAELSQFLQSDLLWDGFYPSLNRASKPKSRQILLKGIEIELKNIFSSMDSGLVSNIAFPKYGPFEVEKIFFSFSLIVNYKSRIDFIYHKHEDKFFLQVWDKTLPDYKKWSTQLEWSGIWVLENNEFVPLEIKDENGKLINTSREEELAKWIGEELTQRLEKVSNEIKACEQDQDFMKFVANSGRDSSTKNVPNLERDKAPVTEQN